MVSPDAAAKANSRMGKSLISHPGGSMKKMRLSYLSPKGADDARQLSSTIKPVPPPEPLRVYGKPVQKVQIVDDYNNEIAPISSDDN